MHVFTAATIADTKSNDLETRRRRKTKTQIGKSDFKGAKMVARFKQRLLIKETHSVGFLGCRNWSSRKAPIYSN